MPAPQTGDLATIQQPLEFFAANIYSGNYIRTTSDGVLERGRTGISRRPRWAGRSRPRRSHARGVHWGLRCFHERYQLPIVITENGMATDDADKDSDINDPLRIKFLQQYLQQYARAIADGVRHRGISSVRSWTISNGRKATPSALG